MNLKNESKYPFKPLSWENHYNIYQQKFVVVDYFNFPLYDKCSICELPIEFIFYLSLYQRKLLRKLIPIFIRNAINMIHFDKSVNQINSIKMTCSI